MSHATPPYGQETPRMIAIDVRDGYYIVKAPKMVLVLTREQFIAALKAGKRWKRRQAQRARESAHASQ